MQPGTGYNFRNLSHQQTELLMRPLPFLALLVSTTTTTAVAQTSWGTSGNFRLSKTSAVVQQDWTTVEQSWSRTVAFELSRPGAPAPSKLEVLKSGTKVAKLLDLIGQVEAGKRGYDSIHLSAKRLPRTEPSNLTVDEVFKWIRETPGQHHAIGKYQIIPATLLRLTRTYGVAGTARYDTALQDELGYRLLVEAGLKNFQSGKIGLDQFMNQIAKVWAGFPMQNGKSAYHGKAGNRAVITREQFEAAMRDIFAV